MKAKALEIRWYALVCDLHALSADEHRKVAHPYAKTAAAAVSEQQPDQHDPTKTTDAPSPPPSDSDDKLWRLATAGGDKNVRLWLVYPRPAPPPAPLVLGPSTSKLPLPTAPAQDTGPRVEYLATLKQHTGVVNVVRWSPVGTMLASAGDDGNVLFWVPGESATQFGESVEDKAYEKESWRVKSMLRTTAGGEIYDLAWSPDGTYILAGSVDHTANIYDVSSGHLVHTIAEHTNYVQGVAWDPHGHFIATQSSDRSMHVYSIAQNPAGGLHVHAVGKNSRMDVQHQAGGSWRPPTPFEDRDWDSSAAATGKGKDASASASAKGKDAEVPALGSMPTLHRSVSQRSDSDRSEASSSRFSLADATASGSNEPTSMDPPAAPRGRPTSRRSSTSGSQSHLSSHSPALGPSAHRHLRSPSPAPLPAVRAPADKPDLLKAETLKLYGDANSTPFFRRLCWSTDGSLLLTPAGLFEDPYGSIAKYAAESADSNKKKAAAAAPSTSSSSASTSKKSTTIAPAVSAAPDTTPKPTVYIYSRSNVARPPIAHLPGHKTTSIAIRFCPVLWQLRVLRPDGDDEEAVVKLGTATVDMRLPGDEVPPGSGTSGAERPKSLFDLPYRMVYAVATLDCVFLYDTQQAGPICVFGNLHYAPFTDLTWSSDGQTLVVSSQDGYCSIVAFDPLELGTPYQETAAIPLPPPPQAQPLPTPMATPTPSTSTSNTLPTLFAAAAPVPAPAPEKRATTSDSVAATGEPPKKKKKAALTFLGPIGGAS
ncbi:hypothetical protein RQP46_010445 [Phenoliferia psychrophenolica]